MRDVTLRSMRRALGGERGYVGIEFALAVGLLIFPVTILVLSLPTWVERQSAARVAAQEAAREVVLADSWSEGTELGSATAQQVATNHGVGHVEVAFSGALERGGEVVARVTVEMPALVVPAMGRVGSWTWTAVHTEEVDLYRSFPP